MLRMSKLTDYGTLVLVHLARSEDRGEALNAAPDVAQRTGLAEPTVRKLLKALVRGGLVESVRGAAGGYRLARPAQQISAAQILDALEGPVAITECSGHDSRCSLESVCQVSGKWQRINRAIRMALGEISLAELADEGSVEIPEMPLVRHIQTGISRSG